MIDHHNVITVMCDERVEGAEACTGDRLVQFLEPSRQEAVDQARAAGWRLDMTNKRAMCPACWAGLKQRFRSPNLGLAPLLAKVDDQQLATATIGSQV